MQYNYKNFNLLINQINPIMIYLVNFLIKQKTINKIIKLIFKLF